ncbi:hypothetical protein Cal6303_2064 [Calothrix sp. PCC 6303]|nr:hypothetical protein Cal6303_2064 [Calothrix sp. PCC 6303]
MTSIDKNLLLKLVGFWDVVWGLLSSLKYSLHVFYLNW